MASQYTFGQKIAAGFVLVTGLTLVVTATGIYELNSTVEAKDRVINVNAKNLALTEAATAALEKKVAASRGYLLTREDRHIDSMNEARRRFQDVLRELTANLVSDEGKRFAADLQRLEQEHQDRLDHVLTLRRQEKTEAVTSEWLREFDEKVTPVRFQLAGVEKDFAASHFAQPIKQFARVIEHDSRVSSCPY